MTTITVRVSALTGAALDWAVAKCEDFKPHAAASLVIMGSYNPSANWSQGGPIIEREKIESRFWPNGLWSCISVNSELVRVDQFGPAPLIAAMRCYVASKLGKTIEVPSELIK